MTAPPLRIGILGTAKIARGFAQGVSLSKRVTVAAIASRDAVMLFVTHDLNPRALSPKVKGFVPPQAWYVDLSSLDLA